MSSFFNSYKLALFILFISIAAFGALVFNDLKYNPRFLEEKTQVSISPFPIPSPSSTPKTNSSPSPLAKLKLSKQTYTIAVFGDSMVDTMGESLEYLQKALKAEFPQNTFKLYNYGIGGQNVEEGILRFDKSFSYQTRNYPPITQINADVIVLGSFAYNPFSPHDMDRHYSDLIKLYEMVTNIGASVYLLAEIAPLSSGFGKGPNGINWPDDLARLQAQNITENLQNVVNLSRSQNIPLVNAYEISKINERYGNPVYVDANDGIHPSIQGHVLTANLIARTIKLK